jgi:hypothetical protein
MVRMYVVGVVVVQVVNHKVTRVLDENVDDIPDIVPIDGMGLADADMIPAEEGDDISIFISMVLSYARPEKWQIYQQGEFCRVEVNCTVGWMRKKAQTKQKKKRAL